MESSLPIAVTAPGNEISLANDRDNISLTSNKASTQETFFNPSSLLLFAISGLKRVLPSFSATARQIAIEQPSSVSWANRNFTTQIAKATTTIPSRTTLNRFILSGKQWKRSRNSYINKNAIDPLLWHIFHSLKHYLGNEESIPQLDTEFIRTQIDFVEGEASDPCQWFMGFDSKVFAATKKVKRISVLGSRLEYQSHIMAMQRLGMTSEFVALYRRNLSSRGIVDPTLSSNETLVTGALELLGKSFEIIYDEARCEALREMLEDVNVAMFLFHCSFNNSVAKYRKTREDRERFAGALLPKVVEQINDDVPHKPSTTISGSDKIGSEGAAEIGRACTGIIRNDTVHKESTATALSKGSSGRISTASSEGPSLSLQTTVAGGSVRRPSPLPEHQDWKTIERAPGYAISSTTKRNRGKTQKPKSDSELPFEESRALPPVTPQSPHNHFTTETSTGVLAAAEIQQTAHVPGPAIAVSNPPPSQVATQPPADVMLPTTRQRPDSYEESLVRNGYAGELSSGTQANILRIVHNTRQGTHSRAANPQVALPAQTNERPAAPLTGPVLFHVRDFECLNCGRIVNDVRGHPDVAVICLGCGPNSEVRYCTIPCLLADCFTHHEVCRQRPSDLRVDWQIDNPWTSCTFGMKPLRPIYSKECFRQITYFTWLNNFGVRHPYTQECGRMTDNERNQGTRELGSYGDILAPGDYFVFLSEEKAGRNPQEQLIVEHTIKFTDHEEEGILFRRIRNAAFYTHALCFIHFLYNHIVKRTRKNLAGAASIRRDFVMELLDVQFKLEFGLTVWKLEEITMSGWDYSQQGTNIMGHLIAAELRHPILRLYYPQNDSYHGQKWNRYHLGTGSFTKWNEITMPGIPMSPGVFALEPHDVQQGWNSATSRGWKTDLLGRFSVCYEAKHQQTLREPLIPSQVYSSPTADSSPTANAGNPFSALINSTQDSFHIPRAAFGRNFSYDPHSSTNSAHADQTSATQYRNFRADASRNQDGNSSRTLGYNGNPNTIDYNLKYAGYAQGPASMPASRNSNPVGFQGQSPDNAYAYRSANFSAVQGQAHVNTHAYRDTYSLDFQGQASMNTQAHRVGTYLGFQGQLPVNTHARHYALQPNYPVQAPIYVHNSVFVPHGHGLSSPGQQIQNASRGQQRRTSGELGYQGPSRGRQNPHRRGGSR